MGKIWAPSYKGRELNETLRVLNPTTIEYFSLSTQLDEMRKVYPDPVHEVFRMNDRRRYSMYFHRCMAYRMVLRYEEEHRMKFDWVVLVRLDAQWLDPVLPIESYASDRVWLTETGYVLLNDQFMLIPRQFSDYLYDLDTKVVQEGVYCLGGPDVETWKCDAAALRSRGVEEATIQQTLRHCCEDVLRLLASKDRTGPNEEGFSETIHLRHLAKGKIPVALGYFPVLLTRLQAAPKQRGGQAQTQVCNPECGRLYYNAKEYFFTAGLSVYPYAADPVWPDTRYRALTTRDQVLCELVNHPQFPWTPISAEAFHALAAKQPARFGVDYARSVIAQQSRLHPSILPPAHLLAAWRLHPCWNAEGCLTYSFSAKKIIWDQCNDHFRKRGGLRMDPSQMFFLAVYPPKYPSYLQGQGLPAISAFDAARRTEIQLGGRHDYTTLNPNVYVHPVAAPQNVTRIMLLDRDPASWNFLDRVLCLTASKYELNAPLSMQPCRGDGQASGHFQDFLAVRGTIDGSHPHTTIGRLQLVGAPQWCVSRYFNHRVNTDTDEDKKDGEGILSDVADYPSKGDLFLAKCFEEGRLFLTKFEFERITT